MSAEEAIVDNARVAIGISFGNSNSLIAFTNSEGKAEVIANEDGDRQIPSVLSYVADEEYHGTQAKTHLVRNPRNTIAYFRDYLGKDFKSIDPTPCHGSAHPVEVDGGVGFTFEEKEGEQVTLPVSEIATRNFKRLASSASDFLGKNVNAAVLTVPSDFTDEQKAALTKAATDAGIEVLQIINEAAAAVLAYDARPEATVSDKLIVVADLGGTRSDVAVIASRDGIYTILATAHDYELGGANLDQVLIDHFAKEFVKKHKKDPRENERSLAKLKLEAEAVKKALSLGTNASFSVESLVDGVDYSSTVNRLRYEILASKVFSGFTALIERVVKKAELDVLDIDEVILNGGSSHTPKIASLLQGIFPESTTILAPSTTPTAIKPSDVTVRGAAIQASLIQEFEHEDIEQSTHAAVTVNTHLAQAIGVVVKGKDGSSSFQPIFNAETAVPARRTKQFAGPAEGGDVLVTIAEGVREIKVTKPEPKVKEDKKAKVEDGDDEDDDSDDDDDDEEEEEDTREKVWKVGTELAQLALRDVKKGAKIEVGINVSADLALNITAREVGGKGAVRGVVEKA